MIACMLYLYMPMNMNRLVLEMWPFWNASNTSFNFLYQLASFCDVCRKFAPHFELFRCVTYLIVDYYVRHTDLVKVTSDTWVTSAVGSCVCDILWLSHLLSGAVWFVRWGKGHLCWQHQQRTGLPHWATTLGYHTGLPHWTTTLGYHTGQDYSLVTDMWSTIWYWRRFTTQETVGSSQYILAICHRLSFPFSQGIFGNGIRYGRYFERCNWGISWGEYCEMNRPENWNYFSSI